MFRLIPARIRISADGRHVFVEHGGRGGGDRENYRLAKGDEDMGGD